ncbi:MAG: alpha-amylase, partial [Bacteroidetes bacterium]
MGLLHEVFHIVLQAYREDVNRDAFEQCDKYLTSHLGADAVNNFLKHLADIFPSLSVYRGQQTIEQFFNTATDGIPNRQILLEEIILLHLQHHNPALQTMSDLIEEKEFFESEQYNTVINLVEQFFDEQPAFSPEEQPLLKMLFSSIHSSPNSLSDQLFFIQSHWKKYIERFRQEFFILQALDFLKEEGKYFLMQKHIAAQAQMERSIVPSIEFPFFHGFGGEKESPPVPVFPTGGEPEPEQFSPDINWMPRLVLIAKNAFVWLNQLSKQYSRSITRLDEIPDDELSRLSSYGITGLWLIGIWNRSKASKRIKHLHGNIDAEASAYSLDGYDISEELGGYSAYYNLRERARAKGIRLACDMVPNHMGIDSQWVINHPDWFIQTEAPPYFNYSFTGPDLSNNDRVGIYIEDGYWRRSDAAVVFKRHDRYTGDVKYIYHGNDGTNMPWNDTAQLDFMKPEVREAVIQTILHVARLFPVIRFDAAMTLAKKHYQRLWFPQPGTAGAVPSRAMFAMTKEQFDAQMPIEFWREVVDRVQQEVPDTLLLAEAFWLMEGYFVRTLGMHRVYNSAFMHMLKKEENTNFKQTIKNVLEYNPQILKRHVNFMSNPDEETAIAQFGSHDKYFGVCVMMITLPGLPMFGHGQLEGFTEKYGMEYRRAYYDEAPNYHLLYRHEQEIFQLLKKRYLFAEVENFQMYDFYNEDGVLNDDVFAYSNRYGNERALIVYNNAYERATGRIHPASAKQMLGERLIESTIGAALQ